MATDRPKSTDRKCEQLTDSLLKLSKQWDTWSSEEFEQLACTAASSPNTSLCTSMDTSSNVGSAPRTGPRAIFRNLRDTERQELYMNWLLKECGKDGGEKVSVVGQTWLRWVKHSLSPVPHRRIMIEFFIRLLKEELISQSVSADILKTVQLDIRTLDAETVCALVRNYVTDIKEGRQKDNRWLDVVSALVQRLYNLKSATWIGIEITGVRAHQAVIDELLTSCTDTVEQLKCAIAIVRDSGQVGTCRRKRYLDKLVAQLSLQADPLHLGEASLKLLALVGNVKMWIGGLDDECVRVVVCMCMAYRLAEKSTMNTPTSNSVAASRANSNLGEIEFNELIESERGDGEAGTGGRTSSGNEDGSAQVDLTDAFRKLMAEQAPVLAEIRLMAQKWPGVGQGLIKAIKEEGVKSLDCCFTVGLLLALTTLPRTQQKASDLLKKLICNVFHERERIHSCLYLKQRLEHHPLPDVQTVVGALVEARYGKNSKSNNLAWAMAIDSSVIDLGFMLIESPVRAKMVAGRLPTLENETKADQALALLGRRLLFQCFKNDEDMCSDIFDRIIDGIIKRHTSDNAYFLISLVAQLTRSCFYKVSLCEARILDVIGILPELGSKAAVPLLASLMLLIAKRPNTRRKLLDTLKSALLSRSADNLRTAINGFLLFLREFRGFKSAEVDAGDAPFLMSQSFPTFSSQLMHDISQCNRDLSISGQEGFGGKTYDVLCVEAISCLKRALCTYAETRAVLYKGLAMLAEKNAHTINPSMDLLLTQLRCFLRNGPGPCPLHMESIVDAEGETVRAKEPLGVLIRALHRCCCLSAEHHRQNRLTSTQEGEEFDAPTAVRQLDHSFLVNAFRKQPTDDNDDAISQLDKTTDFGASVEGRRNAELAGIAISVYDALLEFVWCFMPTLNSADDADLMLQLVDKRDKLIKILKEKKVSLNNLARKDPNQAKKPGTGRGAVKMSVDTHLELRTLQDMVAKIMFDKSPMHAAGLDQLRAHDTFKQWMMDSVLVKVTGLTAAFRTNRTSEVKETGCYGYLVKLACDLLKFYMGAATSPPSLVDALSDHAVSDDDPLRLLALNAYVGIVSCLAEGRRKTFLNALKDIFRAVGKPTDAPSADKLLSMNIDPPAAFDDEMDCAWMCIKHIKFILDERFLYVVGSLPRPSTDRKAKPDYQHVKHCIAMCQVPNDGGYMWNMCVKLVARMVCITGSNGKSYDGLYEPTVAKEVWQLYKDVGLRGCWMKIDRGFDEGDDNRSVDWLKTLRLAAMRVYDLLSAVASRRNDALPDRADVIWCKKSSMSSQQSTNTTRQESMIQQGGDAVNIRMTFPCESIQLTTIESVAPVLVSCVDECLKTVKYAIELLPRKREAERAGADIVRFFESCAQLSHTLLYLYIIHRNEKHRRDDVVNMFTNFYDVLSCFVDYSIECIKCAAMKSIDDWEFTLPLRDLNKNTIKPLLDFADGYVGLDDGEPFEEASSAQDQCAKDKEVYPQYVRARTKFFTKTLELAKKASGVEGLEVIPSANNYDFKARFDVLLGQQRRRRGTRSTMANDTSRRSAGGGGDDGDDVVHDDNAENEPMVGDDVETPPPPAKRPHFELSSDSPLL